MFLLVYISGSYELEKEAFTRCMLDILNVMDLHIRVVSTDRHVSIKKLMKTDERCRHILHGFDLWHVGKSMLKKIMKSSQKEGYKFFDIAS